MPTTNSEPNNSAKAVMALLVVLLVLVVGYVVVGLFTGGPNSSSGSAIEPASPVATGSPNATTTAADTAAGSEPTMAVDDPPTTTTVATTTTTTTSTTTSTTSTTTTTLPELALIVPVAPGINASWGPGHGANYKAADIFTACDAPAVSPTNGLLLEVRRENRYDPAVDNPATRGGRSIAILGDDGVRYYMAHFETIVDGIEPGQRVTAGQPLATVGQTGRASACHIHMGLSPDCSGPNHDGKEWSVRRGVIWPQPYLDAWQAGQLLSPRDEVDAWVAANPNACAEALADPYAADS